MIQAALIGAGLLLQQYGQMQADAAQADAEAKNASFYREQAAFARKSGDRQRMIFDRESQIAHGEQVSAYAKAGLDSTVIANFIAKEQLFRQQEGAAIEEEADMNVRLANLRAEQADETARELRSPNRQIMQLLGGGLMFAGKVL